MDPVKTTHPCGAVGVQQVEVLVPRGWLKEYVTLFASITGSTPEMVTGKEGVYFELGLPRDDARRAKLWVHAELDDSDREWLSTRGIGISGLSLFIPGREDHGSKTLGEDGWRKEYLLYGNWKWRFFVKQAYPCRSVFGW